jgi:hypothetical protein
MKPSEKIREIYGEQDFALRDVPRLIRAILQYLDDEYKKNNPKCFCKKVGCDKNEHTYKAELK